MENFKTWIGMLLLIVLMSMACVKEPQDIPPGLTSDPVFGLSGQFGTQSIDIDAGLEEWTFVPVVREDESLHIYSAVLSKNGCLVQCPDSWTFNFYQSLTNGLNEEQKFLETIHPGPVDFVLADAQRDSYLISIATHPELFMNGVSFWQDPGNPPIYANGLQDTIGAGEVFDACFQSIVYSGCQYSQCVYFQPATLKPCLVHLEVSVENGRYVVLSAVPEGTPPYQYEWEDGFSTPTIVVTAQDSVTDIYAEVTITDANGNKAELKQTVRFQNGIVDACYYPIELQSTLYTNTSSLLAAGDMEIIHTDANGEVWNSTGGIQPDESYVNIEQVDYYGLAPSALPSFKTKLVLHVRLTNQTTGETRWFDATQLVLPLVHP